MTTAEQTAYNNGFILGMTSKGIIRVVEIIGETNEILATEINYELNVAFEEVGL